jgi:hypothetical protein
MYGPLVVAAAVLFSMAAVALFLSDLGEARSRRAIERIHQEGRSRRLP